MKIHKHGKHIKTINTVIESCLIVILIVLVAIMMVLIGKLQGTARVINYTGLVRGATQREVKLEITGNPNDELINYLDGILEDLKSQAINAKLYLRNIISSFCTTLFVLCW